jgi:alkylation response protein AidB-like acyl-CoA dehydrogenase
MAAILLPCVTAILDNHAQQKGTPMTTNLDSILQAARDHAEQVIKPNVDRWNTAKKWPRDASDKAGAAGLTGLYAPQEFGGQGLPLSEGIQVYEQLGLGDGAYAFALSMHNICTFAGCGYGTDAFKEKWARDLTSGRKLANFALTEPQSGSDPMQMYTRATINGDGTWTISGSKAWVSLATEADVYFTVVKTSDAPGHKDMAMIAIPADAEGLSFGPMYETPSYNFLPMSEMYMDKVVVSEDNIILPVGQGLQGSLMAIDIARVSIASGCCGLMQAALDTALSYSKNRKMFGGKNLDLDGIQWMLGEVATDLEASRLLYRKAAEALGTPEGPLMAAHAKRFVPDAAVKAANTCTQVLGGMGLLQPYGLDRLSRLAQMLRIVDGTTEISRVVIGRALQKRAATLPDLPVPKGFGETDEPVARQNVA